MQIVIPMAGDSGRFRKVGCLLPKQFILVEGRPMIHWVCDMFSHEDEFVFIVQKAHSSNSDFRKILETAVPKYKIIGIDPHNLGPVHTALAADPVMDDDEPVVFTYCDFYQHWNYKQFLQRVEMFDGGIAVFKGFHPASFNDTNYAYLKCNENGEMLELREKQSFTDKPHKEYASTGIYYVRSWDRYRHFAKEVLREGHSIGGEYYISLIFNHMVKQGLNVITYMTNKFICWGTPEDVEEYCFWSDFFKKDTNRILHSDMASI